MQDQPIFSKLALACDHAGFTLKQAIHRQLASAGMEIVDCGTNGTESVDYPDYGHAAARAVLEGLADGGIIVCGSGIGISIAANRHNGIRAALCCTPEMAVLARQHNDANILALGARIIDEATAFECVDAFLTTAFEGGRHARRIAKL